MTLFNPVFNRQTPKGLNRLKTQADEGLTPADEAGSVVLRQPPASELANLFRIDAWDHALGLVRRQVGGRVTGGRWGAIHISQVAEGGWPRPLRQRVDGPVRCPKNRLIR